MFRADKLRVIKILNVNKPDVTKDSVETTMYPGPRKTIYAEGKNVLPDKYDEDINSVYTNGIHYFKSFKRAYFYGEIPSSYSGTGCTWHETGQLSSIGKILKGLKAGKWISYDYDGRIESEETYENGKLHGESIKWFNDKIKREYGFYENGIMSGRWMYYHKNHGFDDYYCEYEYSLDDVVRFIGIHKMPINKVWFESIPIKFNTSS